MNLSGTVLLVEDNELNRDMMIRRLSRAGFDVLTAGNGKQALDIMHSKMPCIVLMDMNLPVLDGWAASRRAKEERISGTSRLLRSPLTPPTTIANTHSIQVVTITPPSLLTSPACSSRSTS